MMQERYRPSRRTAAAVLGLVAVGGLAWLWQGQRGFDPANPNVVLADIEAKVSKSYPVPEITAATLAGSIGKPDIVLFDVREESEFAQSQIAGARRIDPGMPADEFMARYGDEVRGKTVVFYCAVGVRSGAMLTRVQQSLPAHGALAAYNLRGGIFRWYAAGGNVVAHGARAGSVHPYDSAWSKLLQRTIAERQGAPRP